MKQAGAFLVGAVVGAILVGVALHLLERPLPEDPRVPALQHTADSAAAIADSAEAVGIAQADSLERMRRKIDALLALPPRVVPGPTPGTVVIAPADSGDTARVVQVPPEVVAQLEANAVQIAGLLEERAIAFRAVASLRLAAETDSVADGARAEAHRLEVGILREEVRRSRRSALVWKVAAVGVVGVSLLTR